MTDHTARPESWDHVARQAKDDYPYADCLMELRARVERLEQAQQQPEPGDDQTLHTVALRMVDTLANLDVLPEITNTIRRAIREPMQPAPSAPAGKGELVGLVAKAIVDAPPASLKADEWTPEAIAAILAVADWLALEDYGNTARLLRREVGR